MRKVLKPIVIIALMVLVVFMGTSLFAYGDSNGADSPEKVVDEFMEGFVSADADAIFNLIPTDFLLQYVPAVGMGIILEVAEKELEDGIRTLEEQGMAVSYEILGVKSISESQMEDIKNSYKETDITVSDAMLVETEIAVQSTEETDVLDMEFCVIKIGSTWYLDLTSI